MRAPIVVVGSLNADLVVNLRQFPVPGETIVGRRFGVFPGGKGANQAYAAARLGGRVSMIGRVGNDTHADLLLQSLQKVGVNVAQVRRDPKVSTGIACILIDVIGENQIVIVPGANGGFVATQMAASRGLLASARIVLLQLEIPLKTVETTARLAKENGAVVILDPAPAQPLSDRLISCVDYLTPNETELAILTRTPHRPCPRAEIERRARTLCRRGAKKVLVKMGIRGALLIGGEEPMYWPAFRVRAVDTTAAGDAFNGAFAFALAAGQPEAEAGRFAAAAAACSVTRPGAQPSMPTRPEAERLLRDSR